MSKTIFVIMDGCGSGLARENMGYLEHMAECGKAGRYRVCGELPSMSRPLYETLLSGLAVSEHGVANNLTVRRSRVENVFSLCVKNGLGTAAAAYYWMSELYGSAPFDRIADRLRLNAQGDIRNGIFYFEDEYPDSHVLCDAEYLRANFDPELMLIHTMNIDDAGHKHGQGSREQAEAAMKLDVALSSLLPAWLELGYAVVITADHAMDAHGLHGGNTAELREVPLYIFAKGANRGVFRGDMLPQRIIAPLLCELLGIAPAAGMMDIDESGVELFERD